MLITAARLASVRCERHGGAARMFAGESLGWMIYPPADLARFSTTWRLKLGAAALLERRHGLGHSAGRCLCPGRCRRAGAAGQAPSRTAAGGALGVPRRQGRAG